jgi:Fe-S-cluster-containing hydrogenase component 2
MEAIKTEDGRSFIDADRCIGCGLCISTCPVNAVKMLRKSKPDQRKVAKDMQLTYLELAKNRGKINTPRLVGMLMKSKLDRMLTSF